MRIAIPDGHYLSGPISFGIGRIADALHEIGHEPIIGEAEGCDGIIRIDEPEGFGTKGRRFDSPESFGIETAARAGVPTVSITGSDPRGLMYGLLDTAGGIRSSGPGAHPFTGVTAREGRPDCPDRAVSIYTMHQGYFEARLHDPGYLDAYLALLAESRINCLVLVFGYENGGFLAPPYPYFFDVPGFESVRFSGLSLAEQRRNAESLGALIRAAHDHGVEFVPAVWDHIYRGGVQDGGIAGAAAPGEEREGIVTGLDSGNLMPYTLAALERFLELFDGIDGIQFRLHNESGLRPEEMAAFWHRVFTMIHGKRPGLRVDIRAKEVPDSIIEDAVDTGLDVRVCTKYWMEQMGMPFHPAHVSVQNQFDRRHGYADLLRHPRGYRMQWRLWNGGTSRLHLWGDPGYVRRFIESLRICGPAGFEVNEPLATLMLGAPRDSSGIPIHREGYRSYRYEFERYWLFYLLFGRIGYDRAVSDEPWEDEFHRRFGSGGRALMEGMSIASRVLPRIVASCYRYGNFPTTVGWAERDPQGTLPEFALAEGTDIQLFASMREEAESRLTGAVIARRLPSTTSAWFTETAAAVRRAIADAGPAPGKQGAEYRATLADLEILALIAEFYALRIPAAIDYLLYRTAGDLHSLDRAVEGERAALSVWERMIETSAAVFTPGIVFGARTPALRGEWSEELAVLRAALHQLQEEASSPAPGSRDQCAPSHVPVRRLGTGEDFRVRATWAGDTGKGRLRVCLIDRDRNTRYLAMNRAGAGRFETAVPAAELPEAFGYFIELQSGRGDRICSPAAGLEGPIEVLVSDDRDPPSIFHKPPASAATGCGIELRVRAEDAAGIAWVRIRYRRLTQYEEYRILEMAEERDGEYRAVIPAGFVTADRDLMYYIEAADNAGNASTYPDPDVACPYYVVPVERA